MKLDTKISLNELARHIAKMTTMICSHQDVLIAMGRLKIVVLLHWARHSMQSTLSALNAAENLVIRDSMKGMV